MVSQSEGLSRQAKSRKAGCHDLKRFAAVQRVRLPPRKGAARQPEAPLQARRNGSFGVVARRRVTGWIAREPCLWARKLDRDCQHEIQTPSVVRLRGGGGPLGGRSRTGRGASKA